MCSVSSTTKFVTISNRKKRKRYFGQCQLFIVCNNLSKHSHFYAPCVCTFVYSSATVYHSVRFSLSLPNDDRNVIYPIDLLILLCVCSGFLVRVSILMRTAFISMKIQFPTSFFSLSPYNFKDFVFSFTFYAMHVDRFIFHHIELSITNLVCTFWFWSNLFSFYFAIVRPLNRSSHTDT